MGTMRDTPIGAQLPVELRPGATTDEDAFEEAVLRILRLFYQPPISIDDRRAVPDKTSYLRPDFRVWVGDETIEVADAKMVGRIRKRDVLKLAIYRRVTNASVATIYAPHTSTESGVTRAFRRLWQVRLLRLK